MAQTPVGLPEYENPPINEVALGCRFAPIDGLTIPDVGAFWTSIRAEFPRVEHALPAGDAQGNVAVDEVTGLPWPRVWLLNEDKTRLVQIQRDRFLFNWRRLGSTSTQYPRYSQISTQFFKLFAGFRDYVRERCSPTAPRLLSCELTYINHIEFDGGQPIESSQLTELFKGGGWLTQAPDFLGSLTHVNWTNVYALPHGLGHLAVKLLPAKRVQDDKAIVVLELSVHGEVKSSEEESVRSWMDRAHTVIVTGFAGLTSDDAQEKMWGRI